MERLHRLAALMMTAAVLFACDKVLTEDMEISFSFPVGSLATRSSNPEDEDGIYNLNILVFNHEGLLEKRLWYPRMAKAGDISIRLLKNMPYTVYAFANFGFRPEFPSSEAEVREFRYYLAYPDEYKEGIPMSGKLENFIAGEDTEVEIPMVRMMSKISLRIDRSKLADNTAVNIYSVEIGNCPRSSAAFGPSWARGSTDILHPGFHKALSQVDALNKDMEAGLSGEVSVFMLENMQGDLLEGVNDDADKTLEGNAEMAAICSYIEIKADYRSQDYYSRPGEYLVYRFYLGESRNNFDIRRNCHYTFTVTPSGSGIDDDGWRVDKSALARTAYN